MFRPAGKIIFSMKSHRLNTVGMSNIAKQLLLLLKGM